jgi:AcrR family transcriptional regulator
VDLRNDRGSATRLKVLNAATRLFAEQGYDRVSIEAVLAECRISKGALYHHFHNKEALFTAVLETVEARIVDTVAGQSSQAANPLDALRAGCGAWLDLVVSDAAVRRIAVIDAPAVLGWHAWRGMEARYALGLLKAALHGAASLGCFDPARASTYASMLLAVLNEMAMLIALSEDRSAAIAAARDAAELLISRLVGVEAGAPWSPPLPRN